MLPFLFDQRLKTIEKSKHILFNYSNINYGVLGTLVEKVSNLRFDVFCQQEIFSVLGLDASFHVNDLSNINNVAVLYRKLSGVWTPQADNYQGVYPGSGNTTGYAPGTNGLRFSPQGGLRISAKDLAMLFRLFLNQGTINGQTILTPASVQSMMAQEWLFNGSNGNNYFGLFLSWGLGMHRITNTANNDSSQMFGHPGEAYGLISDAYVDTLRKFGFVFITNGCGVGYQTASNTAFYTIEKTNFRCN
jgi:CubicO group peptidase (beta-lactamase class C family)